MRILLAINSLEFRGGGVAHVRDLATGLVQRGHTPIIYAAHDQSIENEMRRATIPVVDDLAQVGTAPDIIHGHNHLKTMVAVLHFHQTPAVYTCHSWSLWQDAPPVHPRIVSYIAVDYTCRDRLTCKSSIPEKRVHVVLNAVDLERFQQRGPLPSQPRKALVFSNHASEETYLNVVREACSASGIMLDVIGAGAGKIEKEPEKVLGNYDLVFAKARCALEAMAAGCAVIVCDAYGLGPMVTTAEFQSLRPANFGIRTLRNPVNAETLRREIARYDATDAADVTRMVRAGAGRDDAVDQTVEIYEHAISSYKHSAVNGDGIAAEGRAAAQYLAQLDAEMAAHAVTSQRMKERISKVPIVGRLGVKLARTIAGKK